MELNSKPDRHDKTHVPLGLFCILLGLTAFWVARDYETGTVVSMGPGFFPKAISAGLIVLGGLVLLLRGRDLPEDDDMQHLEAASLPARIRIIASLTGSIVVFGATLLPLGLIAATFLMVVIASLAYDRSRLPAILATAVALAAFATVLFPYALGLNIPVLPQVLQ